MKILLFLLAIILLPVSVQAGPNIILSKDINNDCKSISKYACYLTNTKTIYILENLDIKLLPYIFFHEYGHYLTADLSKKQLTEVFGHLIESYNKNVYEIAADHFYLFVYHQNFLTENEKNFWYQQLNKKI